MWVHGLSAPCVFQIQREKYLMPLHRGAPRAPTVRWALRWLERKHLMAEILRGMQLMHMYLMLDANSEKIHRETYTFRTSPY
jgi:hypothetical protein